MCVPLKCLVTTQHVVRGRREGMLWSEPIVRDKCSRSRTRRNVAYEVAVGLGRSKVKPPTVEVENRSVTPPIRGMNPKSRYATERVGLERHVETRHDAFHER